MNNPPTAEAVKEMAACRGRSSPRSGAMNLAGGASPPVGSTIAWHRAYVTASPGGSYSYSLTGTLPPGLTFYSAIGLVYGYPTAAGSSNFSVTATSVNNCTGTRAYTVAIAP